MMTKPGQNKIKNFSKNVQILKNVLQAGLLCVHEKTTISLLLLMIDQIKKKNFFIVIYRGKGASINRCNSRIKISNKVLNY